VGQHYQPPTWEDRGMVIKGPALVELKRAAKNLCVSQGYRQDEIPEYLRDRPFPADYQVRCDKLKQMGWRAPVSISVNNTGFGRKAATVLKATNYNLAGKGGVLLAIDSLWLSDFWAGMFICAALRGVHAYAIAPSPFNAPAAANTILFLMRQNMELMLDARQFLAKEIEPSGGQLHVGFYDHDYSVDNEFERLSTMVQGEGEYPFIREDFPLPESVFDVLREYVNQELAKTQDKDTPSPEDYKKVEPFIHMKTQFYGSRLGMQILREEEWAPIVQKYIDIRLKQVAGELTEGLTPVALAEIDPNSDRATVVTEFLDYLDTLPADVKTKVVYGFTIGSMNQDRRGMISDGEILACIAGYHALIAVLDMTLISTTSTWVEDASDFDTLFPAPNLRTTVQRLSRYLQDLF
jgi:hypothetical protein